MAEQTEKHPNVILLDRFYDAYAREDMAAVREIFAPDIIWRIPGHHPLSGPKHGADEVLAFFDQLAKADFKADVQAISAVDDYVLEFHRGWSDYGPKLDVMWTLVFRFEGECIEGGVQYVRRPACGGSVLLRHLPPQAHPGSPRCHRRMKGKHKRAENISR